MKNWNNRKWYCYIKNNHVGKKDSVTNVTNII